MEFQVADLTERHRGDIIAVLDGIGRERADTTGVTVLTARLNIRAGTK